MSTRHIAAEDARLSDLTPEGSSGRASRRFRRRLALDGFTVDEGFRLKPGYLYTVVRAISARVNQNYDGWPSDELKKSYRTFIGKPVFVNHENHDPTKARGVVVAARYVENGPDRYIEVVQEVDAERFPKLAHEIKTGGLDSVSMGAEAGFTICSYCHNRATDLHDMCDHVQNHKGKTLSRLDRKTGKREEVLVFESCHKISFFELSYVFEPADETAVASKVVVAGLDRNAARNDWELQTIRKNKAIDINGDSHDLDWGQSKGYSNGERSSGLAPKCSCGWQSDSGSEASGRRNFTDHIKSIKQGSRHKHAGDCPPGMDCSRGLAQGEQIGKDTPNNPVNQVSYDPATLGQPGGGGAAGGAGGYQGSGKSGRDGLNPAVRDFYDQIAKDHGDLSLGGYNPVVDQPWDEHGTGDAMDIMISDLERGNSIKDQALKNPNVKHVIWQQNLYRPDGSFYKMPDRGSPTENHYDHLHINIPTPAGYKTPSPTTTTAPAASTLAPAQRAAGKYTKEDFANAGGKKPWETDTATTTRAPVEDADLKEIEAMVREAMPFDPNTQYTQQGKSTLPTYFKAHEYLDSQGAPESDTLDFGAGRGLSSLPPEDGGLGFHTFEPNADRFAHPDGPTFRDCCDVPDASYGRVVSLNVLNVLHPGLEPGQRDHAVREIGRILAPGGHALITTRPDVTRGVPRDRHLDDEPGAVMMGPEGRQRRQKGFTRGELHEYVQGVLGKGYTVSPAPNNIGGAGVMVVRDPVTGRSRRRQVRSAALKKIARSRARKLAWGEKEAPMAVDTLREEGSAPEDDNDDDQRYVDPADDFASNIDSPAELSEPDLSQAAQIDRKQEMSGQDTTGIPGPAEGGPPQDQGNFITLRIPMPGQPPQVPQQAGAPVAVPPAMPSQDPAAMAPPGDPSGMPPQPITAALLDYFDGYYGRRVANWLDAVEAGRDMTPAENADYRRQAARLSTLENGRELSTTNRNPRKGTANMARTSIANRTKVATAGRRQHFAEGPLVDGGERGRNDQGEQEEAFLSQTPPPVRGEYPDEDTHDISNTENNLVARVQRGRAQLLRDAQALARVQQRRAFDESGGPTAVVVDPTVQTGSEGEALTGDGFISADPNDGVVPTNPKDASLRAFKAFDGWLAQKTGKSSRRHTEATIKKAAAQFSREAGISPQALFPALGIVLREARKNNKPNTKGATKMRKRSNESLDVAAPDGRIDVEAPVENVTSAEAQASQFDLRDFGDNAGDDVAKPDLSTDQNWAPGEASKSAARVKTAGGLLAMRCAEGMIAAGLEPNSRERKYALAAEFERMNRGLIQDRVALLERFAAVRQADLHKVASGMSRGAARSPIPAGLGGGTRTAAAPQRLAAHDPRNDSSLFI